MHSSPSVLSSKMVTAGSGKAGLISRGPSLFSLSREGGWLRVWFPCLPSPHTFCLGCLSIPEVWLGSITPPVRCLLGQASYDPNSHKQDCVVEGMMEIYLESSIISPSRLLDVSAKNYVSSIKSSFCKQYLGCLLRYIHGWSRPLTWGLTPYQPKCGGKGAQS